MRASAEKGDRSYRADGWPDALVYLNGVLQDACITADTELNFVKRLKKDPTGCFNVYGDEVPTEIVRGEVKIVLR